MSRIIKKKQIFFGVVRTPGTNPCVRQEKTTNKIDSEVIINLGKNSQILVAVGNSSYKEEHILTTIKSLSTSPDMIDETNSQELQKYFLCKTSEDADRLGITSEGEEP